MCQPKEAAKPPLQREHRRVAQRCFKCGSSGVIGRAAPDTLSSQRLGFEGRIENGWGAVGVGVGGDAPTPSDRAVRSVVRGAGQSHDEMWKFPERSSKRNLERRDRVKEFVTSAEVGHLFFQIIDSILSF